MKVNSTYDIASEHSIYVALFYYLLFIHFWEERLGGWEGIEGGEGLAGAVGLSSIGEVIAL